jgi:hypothetical protein
MTRHRTRIRAIARQGATEQGARPCACVQPTTRSEANAHRQPVQTERRPVACLGVELIWHNPARVRAGGSALREVAATGVATKQALLDESGRMQLIAVIKDTPDPCCFDFSGGTSAQRA